MSSNEVTPRDAQRRLSRGSIFIDVRENNERELGYAEGSIHVPRAELEKNPAQYIPSKRTEVFLICQGGGRSSLAANALVLQGYYRAYSVMGGTSRWISEGFPVSKPNTEVDRDFYERYERHLQLPEMGAEKQRFLESSKILLVGAGGLGSPVGYYLAAAGIGCMRIVDDDVIERSNLQRQILHGNADVGLPKVYSAEMRLSALNPRTKIETVRERVTADNIDRLMQDIDVVVDGSDNFATRYLLNDACIKFQKPMIYGAVQRFEGQASVFTAGLHRGVAPCYRCLFPSPPSADNAPNCSEAGVLGVMPGLVGMIQATETIKVLLGLGEPLIGRLLQVDALTMKFRETRFFPDPDCAYCAYGKQFPGYIDYENFCSH